MERYFNSDLKSIKMFFLCNKLNKDHFNKVLEFHMHQGFHRPMSLEMRKNAKLWHPDSGPAHHVLWPYAILTLYFPS